MNLQYANHDPSASRIPKTTNRIKGNTDILQGTVSLAAQATVKRVSNPNKSPSSKKKTKKAEREAARQEGERAAKPIINKMYLKADCTAC